MEWLQIIHMHLQEPKQPNDRDPGSESLEGRGRRRSNREWIEISIDRGLRMFEEGLNSQITET